MEITITEMLEWNVIDLVWAGVLEVLIVALYHEKVPDSNSCLALLPPFASPSLQGRQ